MKKIQLICYPRVTVRIMIKGYHWKLYIIICIYANGQKPTT